MAGFWYCLVPLLFMARPSLGQIAPPFIVFGDSTIDTGNNNYINTTLEFSANFPPHGQQFFGHPNGRFCNGRVFVDFICEFLGIPYLAPYLRPDADHSKGVNFGSGGAGVLPETNAGLVIPLGRQLKYFSEFQEAIIEEWGSVQANKYISDAIYLVSISNNDYMSGYFSVAELREKYTPQDFIALIVGEIVRACEFLHAKGARKFVVVEAGPLGCVPALRQFDPDQGCFQPAGDLGVAHNGALRMAMKGWQATHADVALSVAGLHQFMMERITSPEEFGFKEGVSACCGTGPLRGLGPCGRPHPVTGEDYEVCDNPEDHVFWDFYHGTEKMHEMFAKDIWNGNGDVISPLSVREMVELSSSADCNDEQLAGYSSGPANLLDARIEHSSF
ncbi:unnamed protein product [Calypogeia fissa]